MDEETSYQRLKYLEEKFTHVENDACKVSYLLVSLLFFIEFQNDIMYIYIHIVHT